MDNHPLSFIHDELRDFVSTACGHLRNSASLTQEAESAWLQILISYQLMADEIEHFINHHEAVETAIQLYLDNQPYDTLNLGEDIYQYCLHYFQRANCPLGSSTDSLSEWVAAYAERHQELAKYFEEHFGDEMSIVTTDTLGNPVKQYVDSAQRFDVNSAKYLRLIEQSHCLSDYNEKMQRVYTLLVAEAPINVILSFLQSKANQVE